VPNAFGGIWVVVPGFVPGIHGSASVVVEGWVAGINPAMTKARIDVRPECSTP
jgi:hypothetical protein